MEAAPAGSPSGNPTTTLISVTLPRRVPPLLCSDDRRLSSPGRRRGSGGTGRPRSGRRAPGGAAATAARRRRPPCPPHLRRLRPLTTGSLPHHRISPLDTVADGDLAVGSCHRPS
ncbi:hypothetical protein DAI22_06g146700 [Oryza sativa Japonica Group]|uniref:Uncharacterized protein n=1 Tax=Oryza nivara TaxID=4536 RepID=A0A0E0HWK9_ORYNI|nr:hypothetical protein DAI22_06g146700 [Oryza sativa Japonica Group]